MFDPATWTYGFEIEWGDVPRSFDIPSHLGSWEYSERDIVNLRDPYKYVAADPLGLDPPVGGEINTKPTSTWREQVDRIFDIRDLFANNNHEPTVCCRTHAHVHVHVPGLTGDLVSLKKLVAYVKDNQKDVVDAVYPFSETDNMKGLKNVKSYMKYDGGRLMPSWMCDNIVNLSTNFDHFIKLHGSGKDGVSQGRPFRYAINTYCLKHTKTIEFRCFRNSLDRRQLESCFRFATLFISAALNDGPTVKEILNSNDFQFPPFEFDADTWKGWAATKWDEKRGKKQRQYHEVV